MRKMRSTRTRRTRTIDLDINIIILVIGIVFIMFHGRCNNGDCFLIGIDICVFCVIRLDMLFVLLLRRVMFLPNIMIITGLHHSSLLTFKKCSSISHAVAVQFHTHVMLRHFAISSLDLFDAIACDFLGWLLAWFCGFVFSGIQYTKYIKRNTHIHLTYI